MLIAVNLGLAQSLGTTSTVFSQAIEEHWQKRTAANPAFFNGAIFVVCKQSTQKINSKTVFVADIMRTDFKTFLYWRECKTSQDIWDGFGTSILRSSDGQVLLGRQSPGHLNSGLAYFPGGFIDERDVTREGAINIEASILRELAEETGIDASNHERRPGYHITRIGQQISIGVEYQSSLTAEELLKIIHIHLTADEEKELSEVFFLDPRRHDQIRHLAPYAKLLLLKLAQHKDQTNN